VAILIKNSIPFTVEDARADPDENFLACRLQIKGCTIILVSVYGPNGNDLQFFHNLRENISSLGDYPIVAGGDWNCLWSKANLGLNIDAFNMVAIPNAANSKKLREMSEMLDVTDPYRVLHPGRKDYSYVPRQAGRTNKSRLDFFLVSNSVIDKIVECNIVPHLQNKLFDHKAILLSFARNRKSQKNLKIEQSTTKEEELDIIVNLAAYETYLRHSGLENLNIGELMAVLARNKRRHRESGLPYGHRTPGDMDELQVMVRAGTITEIRDELAAFPFNDLVNGPLDVAPNFFMEELMNNVRNEVLGYQSFIKKGKSSTIDGIKKRIQLLKETAVPNQEEITELEARLNVILDVAGREELEKHHLFEILNNEKITPAFIKLAKASYSDALLTDIKRENGRVLTIQRNKKNTFTNISQGCISGLIACWSSTTVVLNHFWAQIFYKVI
jgi:hypothetical protein